MKGAGNFAMTTADVVLEIRCRTTVRIYRRDHVRALRPSPSTEALEASSLSFQGCLRVTAEWF